MTESGPTISVAMSVYNGERFLAPAIESVLSQTLTDFEFLILDDGSQDRTRAIIERFAAQDRRIRPIIRENRGLVASLNELLTALHWLREWTPTTSACRPDWHDRLDSCGTIPRLAW